MTTFAKAAVFLLLALFSASAETLEYGWKSYINGREFETKATPEVLSKASRVESVRISPSIGGDLEPRGKCDLKQAIQLADREAVKLIGKEYAGADPSWIMEKAQRVRIPASGVYKASYYEIVYREIIPRGNPLSPGMGSLQVIILLDGTVLPIQPVEQPADGKTPEAAKPPH